MKQLIKGTAVQGALSKMNQLDRQHMFELLFWDVNFEVALSSY